MRRAVWSFLLVLCTMPVLASSPEPSRADIARAVQTCTVNGAFGHRFGEDYAAPANNETGVPPFRIEALAYTVRSPSVFRIAAMASFAKAPMSGEDRIALANWFFRKLDSEIGARRPHVRRTEWSGVVTYYFIDGYELELSHEGVVVRMTCTNEYLRRRLMNATP